MSFGKWLVKMFFIIVGLAVFRLAYGIDTPAFMSWPWWGGIAASVLIVWGAVGFWHPEERE